MHSESSIATRLLACLVVAILLGGAATSVAAGASGPGSLLTSSASVSSGDTTLETGESIDSTLDGSTETVENTTESTTDDIENTTDSTTDTLENETDDTDGSAGVTETGDTVDGTVSTTTDTVDETVEKTTDIVDETTVAGDSIGTETAINGTLETEPTAGSQDSNTTGNGSSDGDSPTSDAGTDDGDDGSGPSSTAGNAETAGDVILVGMLGTITASGAVAGGAGASGAAGTASTATASWLRSVSETNELRRAGSDLWKVLPLFRYSQHDDSDPLEHDGRRTIYETIEAEPGTYLSQISDDTGIPLSTVRYHVRILENEALVTACKLTGKRRYFLDESDAELHAALAEPAKRDVLEALAALGRAHNGRLAEKLDRDPSTISHHLAGLADDGLVVRERDGRSIVNELPSRVETALGGGTVPASEADAAPADD